MKMLFLVFALILGPLLNTACLNIDGTTLDGGTAPDNSRPDLWLEDVQNRSSAEKLAEYRNKRGAAADAVSQKEFEAVEMLMTGKILEGIDGLLAIEKTTPGRYSTATNLGTGYELNGNNKEGLHWIIEGIKRNPNAHEGTEWLHQYILETKIKLESTPKLFQTNRMIELPESFDLNSTVTIGNASYRIDKVSDALQHQLRERMLFVKPADPVVSEMLYAYARIIAHTRTVEPALHLLRMAEGYGFADPAQLRATQDRYERARHLHFESHNWWINFWVCVVVGTSISSVVLLYILKKRSARARS
ncbi:MAG TPA: hypothetical protein VL860_03425 [Planctomycetota bacterium]|nr:hypothetical protein [Planctomycetota bacterium]